MRKIVLKLILLTILLYLFSYSTILGQAPRYYFQVDCHHSQMQDEGTSNQITVSFWNNGTLLSRTYRNVGVEIGAREIPTKNRYQSDSPDCDWYKEAHWLFDGSDHSLVTHITVQTNGGNAFLIDECRWIKSSPSSSQGVMLWTNTTLKKWGAENGKGWCLSTDAADSGGEWIGKVEDCHKALKFRLSEQNPLSIQPPVPNPPLITHNANSKYFFRVDCTSDEGIEDLNTKDRVVVIFRKNSEILHATYMNVGTWWNKNNVPTEHHDKKETPQCGSWGTDAYWHCPSRANEVTDIIVQTTGGDAFFIDKCGWIENRKVGNEWKTIEHAWYGQENAMGWCLSKDAGDDSGNWASKVDGCYTALRFVVATEKVFVVNPIPNPPLWD